MSQTNHIILFLKKTLKNRGLKYSDVAKHLHVSESSIKRQFTQNDISLNRLEKICDLMSMDITDMVEMLNRETLKVEQLTVAQEKKIVSDSRLLLVTISVLNYLTFEEIFTLYDFEKAELIQLLLQLENINLIQLNPNNKIKTLISRTFQWQKNGPIQSYFEDYIQDDFFNCQFNQIGEMRIVINGMISNSSNQIMQKKIKQLAQNFSDYAHKDQNISFDRRFGSSMVIAIRPWELPAFEKYRRKVNNKVFN
jgi:DNA-binding Xre family transcriptional regulator